MRKWLFSLLTLAILTAGCTKIESSDIPNSNKENKTPIVEDKTNTSSEEVEDEPDNSDPVDETTQSENPMRAYFLPNGAKAHFQGEGNEFAELDIEIFQLFDDYLIIQENNGGAFLQKTYKISADKIEILGEDIIEFDPSLPSLAQLEKMKPIGIYLQKPFTVGTSFDGWTITEIGATVETPYQTFDDVIVIESVDEEIINRKYFAQNYGEVKRESIMPMDGEDDFVVTSTLESIE